MLFQKKAVPFYKFFLGGADFCPVCDSLVNAGMDI